jgi:hypothetical protein
MSGRAAPGRPEHPSREAPLYRLLLGAGGCAVAFLLVLGVMALLPRSVQESLPDAVVGGAVLLLGLVGTARLARRSR